MYRVVMFRRMSTALSQGRVEEGGWEGSDESLRICLKGQKGEFRWPGVYFGHRTGAASLVICALFFS